MARGQSSVEKMFRGEKRLLKRNVHEGTHTCTRDGGEGLGEGRDAGAPPGHQCSSVPPGKSTRGLQHLFAHLY